eukprot:COSAG02_NODE_1785_length_10940_cov_9.153399_13_plen_86_part_00
MIERVVALVCADLPWWDCRVLCARLTQATTAARGRRRTARAAARPAGYDTPPRRRWPAHAPRGSARGSDPPAARARIRLYDMYGG